MPDLLDRLCVGTDWPALRRAAREDAAAARAMLPRLRVLLEGTGATCSVSRDGPHELGEGGEWWGFFVTISAPLSEWGEVRTRLAAVGVTWLNEARDPANQDLEAADVLDWPIWRGTCPWGCGQVRSDVERHAARCRNAPEEER